MNEKDDEADFLQVLTSARAGDEQALARLITEYESYLLWLANHELDDELQTKLGASDVVQQSMLRAYQQLSQFRGEEEAEWRAWIRQILRNEVRSRRRLYSADKRQRSREESLSQQAHNRSGLRDRQDTPCSAALRGERRRLMLTAIDGLRPVYGQVIRLRDLDQLSFDDIAARMKRSANACQKLYQRAVLALQQLVESEFPELLGERDDERPADE